MCDVYSALILFVFVSLYGFSFKDIVGRREDIVDLVVWFPEFKSEGCANV